MKISPQIWPVVSSLLDEGLSLPLSDRAQWLDSLQGEAATYRDVLRELLDVSCGANFDNFLCELPRVAGSTSAVQIAELVPGEVIGPYRLVQELGIGGMGAVWLAERDDGAFKRRVALKLPRMTWVPGLVERMTRERDILASLEHPSIARLYDAGLDRHGRPYLALEYVEGKSIDSYAHERGLSVRQKLELLLQVFGAVAFAHSRLVVHRDLKPANILVDGEGQVRLLDFGIAKLLESDRVEETQLTRLAGPALTLDYASPEQIRGDAIATSSDVYSLGVIAYELLTGKKPYRLKRGSRAELEEAIAHLEPPSASSVVEGRANVAALRGDLDAILAKALHKRAADRYPTVDALAQDVQRHLRNEPVSAQAETLLYRTAKFIRRHRAQSLAAGVAFSAVTIGGAVALWQAAEAQRQRDAALAAAERSEASARLAQQESDRAAMQEQRASEAAEAARRAAENERLSAEEARRLAVGERQASLAAAENAKRAEAVAAEARAQAERALAVQEFLFGLFRPTGEAEGEAARLQKMTAMELLAAGAQRVDRLEQRAPEAHAFLLSTLGDINDRLSAPQEALRLRQRALAAAERLHGPSSVEAALARSALARSLWVLNRDKEAVPLYAAALPILQGAKRHREYAVGMAEYSWAVAISDPKGALKLARTAQSALSEIKDDDVQTIGARIRMGETLVRAGAVQEGIEVLKDTQRRANEIFGQSSMAVVESSIQLANLLRQNYDFKSANDVLQTALADLRRADGGQQYRLARALNIQAFLLTANGQGAAAEAAMRESVAIVARSAPAMLGTFRVTLALILLARGDPAQALVELDAGIAGMDPKTRAWANAQGMRSQALFLKGDRAGAQAAAADAVRVIEALKDQSIGAMYNIRLAAAQLAAEAGDRTSALRHLEHLKAASTAGKLAQRTALQVEVSLLHQLKDDDAVQRLTEPLVAELLAPHLRMLHALIDGELALRAAQARRLTDPDLSRRLAQRSTELLGPYVVAGSPLLEQARALAGG